MTTKIEKSLAADFGEVEVINGGISGHNTHDELTQLRRLAPMYQPDLVMVFFFTNDVLAEDQGGAPVSRRQKGKEFLRRNSKFFAYLYYVYRDKLSARLEAPKFLLPQDYFDLDDSKRGWVLFRKSALEMRDYCSQHGAQLLFVIIPTLVNLDEQYPYGELRQATVAFLNASRIELIDLFDAFSPHRPSDLWVSPENPHWNGRGTSIAAGLITDSVKQLWLAERPMSGGAAKPVQGGSENPSQLEVQESR